MTEDHYTRLLGVRDGLAHALITVSNVKRRLTGPGGTYLPPKRHSRKLQNVLNKIAELDKVSDIIQRQLGDVNRALSERQ